MRADLVLQKEDVLKVDIGVHVRGRILDSAFTLTFEPTYDKLLEAVRAATNSGIQVFIRSCLAIVFILPYSDFVGSGDRRATRGSCGGNTGNHGIL